MLNILVNIDKLLYAQFRIGTNYFILSLINEPIIADSFYV